MRELSIDKPACRIEWSYKHCKSAIDVQKSRLALAVREDLKRRLRGISRYELASLIRILKICRKRCLALRAGTDKWRSKSFAKLRVWAISAR